MGFTAFWIIIEIKNNLSAKVYNFAGISLKFSYFIIGREKFGQFVFYAWNRISDACRKNLYKCVLSQI